MIDRFLFGLRETSNKPLLLRTRVLALAFCCLLLSACQKGDAPSSSWEVAVQGLYTATLSQDGELGVVGSINHGASLWDTRKKERLYNWNHAEAEFTGVVAAAVSPEGQYAVTADHRNLVLWRTSTGEPIWFWTAPGDVLSVDLTPNGDFALLGLDDNTAVIFDIKNGGVKRKFTHQGKVRTVSLSQDARYALTGSDDRMARLWDVQTGEELQRWQHENQLVTVALSPQGQFAFTAAQADKAVIWNTNNGSEKLLMPIKKGPYIAGSSYTAARFSEDEQSLLTGSNNQQVQLWNVTSDTPKRTWEIPKKDRWKPTAATVLAVGFNNQGGYVALASNGTGHLLK